MTRRPGLYLRFQIWWNRLTCDHHWHAADAMIAVVCCWCGKETDGWPVDGTDACGRNPIWT